jgi:hypothetical protein
MSQRSFYSYFKENMETMGLPAPDSLFGKLATATATISAIVAAVEKFGRAVTLTELIGAGILSEKLLAVGGRVPRRFTLELVSGVWPWRPGERYLVA